MNKNKSHLYALMIHQANSSWLKSLGGILGQNTALMRRCSNGVREPFSVALLNLFYEQKRGSEQEHLNRAHLLTVCLMTSSWQCGS